MDYNLLVVLLSHQGKMLHPRWHGICMKSLFCLICLLFVICHKSHSNPVVQELRLTLVDTASSYNLYEPEGPGTYAFGYDIDDPETQNTQFRDEERKPDGSVTGRYGWLAADGTIYIVSYTADGNGYRAHLETMPSFKRLKSPYFRENQIP